MFLCFGGWRSSLLLGSYCESRTIFEPRASAGILRNCLSWGRESQTHGVDYYRIKPISNIWLVRVDIVASNKMIDALHLRLNMEGVRTILKKADNVTKRQRSIAAWNIGTCLGRIHCDEGSCYSWIQWSRWYHRALTGSCNKKLWSCCSSGLHGTIREELETGHAVEISKIWLYKKAESTIPRMIKRSLNRLYCNQKPTTLAISLIALRYFLELVNSFMDG